MVEYRYHLKITFSVQSNANKIFIFLISVKEILIDDHDSPLTNASKDMANDKSPGIDDFSKNF